jgi:hypothetical protein
LGEGVRLSQPSCRLIDQAQIDLVLDLEIPLDAANERSASTSCCIAAMLYVVPPQHPQLFDPAGDHSIWFMHESPYVAYTLQGIPRIAIPPVEGS